MEEHMLPCMNKQLFGVECPGCGTQRAIAFLLEGEFYEAFKIFPAIYTLGLFFNSLKSSKISVVVSIV